MNRQETQQRYKSISSQQDTRNPTTNKKVIFHTPVQKKFVQYHTPHRFPSTTLSYQRKRFNSTQPHNHKKHSKSFTSNQIKNISYIKQVCVSHSRYKQANYYNQVLKSLQRKKAKKQIIKLIKNHRSFTKQVKKAHLSQINCFQSIWHNYFIGLKAKQQIAIMQFKQAQKRDIDNIQKNLIKRCKSLKLRSGLIQSLQKKQKLLIKNKMYCELIQTKKQKQKLKHQLLEQQKQKIFDWVSSTQTHLKSLHTKKYINLIQRIQQCHNDKFRMYKKEAMRLKQKYYNVINKLEHSQRMEINHKLQIFQKQALDGIIIKDIKKL